MIIFALETKRKHNALVPIHTSFLTSPRRCALPGRDIRLLLVHDVQVLALFAHLSLPCWWKMVET